MTPDQEMKNKKKKQSEKERQEYLLLNYPADIRRNLRDLELPPDAKRPSLRPSAKANRPIIEDRDKVNARGGGQTKKEKESKLMKHRGNPQRSC